MTVHTPTPHAHQLADLRADVDQLTQPITVPVRQRIPVAGRRVTRWTALDHPSLLDQLRAATQPGASTVRGPERRQVPRSRPAAALDPLVVLSEVYVELAGWHTGLNLPSPPREADWQKTALHQLAAEARRLSPDTVAAIAGDVHGWWSRTATATGWTTAELITLRRG